MKSLRASRGTAIAETAVVLSFTLIMLFGLLDFVLTGYFEIAADAATFYGAHQAAVTGSTNMSVFTSGSGVGMFPSLVNPGNITFTQTVPPSQYSSVPVSYSTAQNARDGGVSVIVPVNMQAAFSASFTQLFPVLPGGKFPISSGSVEAFYQLANGEFDV